MLIVYDEKTIAKSLNCAKVRSHVVVPTHVLHERFNLTGLKGYSKLVVNLSKLQQYKQKIVQVYTESSLLSI